LLAPATDRSAYPGQKPCPVNATPQKEVIHVTTLPVDSAATPAEDRITASSRVREWLHRVGQTHRDATLQADLRGVEQVLTAPEVVGLLDLTAPVGVIMAAVLHFLSDRDDPAGIIAGYLDAAAPGSVLIASHATSDGPAGHRVTRAAREYTRTQHPAYLRSRDEFAGLLAPVELVEPGIVWTSRWRPEGPADPDTAAANSLAYAAVGLTRAPDPPAPACADLSG
jgi:hypothetical protein